MSANSLPSGNWRFDPFTRVLRFVAAPVNYVAESGRQLKPCGTKAAYNRHRTNGEQACEACKAAARESYRRSTNNQGKR